LYAQQAAISITNVKLDFRGLLLRGGMFKRMKEKGEGKEEAGKIRHCISLASHRER